MASQASETPPARAWSDLLLCEFHGVRVLSQCAIALDLVAGHSACKSGAIALATALLPRVSQILCHEGGRPSVIYLLADGEWETHSHDWSSARGRPACRGSSRP